MRRVGIPGVLAIALALVIVDGSAGAGRGSKACGRVAAVLIHAHNISCRTAYRALSGPVVLGGKVYGAPTGQGWGTAHPHFIYNGGDASGSITNAHWSSWGGVVAHGRGRHPIFKPHGGYYRRPVVALLKAIDIGRCEGRDAYLRLLIREPRRPGGPLGPWRSWSGPQTICEPYGSARR